MPLMKEIKTPLAFLGIRYYKDENGVYYKKVGKKGRQTIKPLWKMKRLMLGVPLIIILGLGFVGYRFGLNIASDKVMNEVTSQITNKDIEILLKEPSIQELIEKEVGIEKTRELLEKYSVDITKVNPDSLTDTNSQPSTSGSDKNTEGKNTTKDDQHGTDNKNGQQVDDNQEEGPNGEQTLSFKSREEVTKFMLSKFSMSELTNLAKKANGGITSSEKAEIRDALLNKLTKEEYDAVKVFGVIELSKGI
jgi:hypothetical protein